MLKISAVYLIGKAEIPIHYTSWVVVEQALLNFEYLFWFIQLQLPVEKKYKYSKFDTSKSISYQGRKYRQKSLEISPYFSGLFRLSEL